ncbi:MAG: ABC transporter permease [Clostridiaceae bacterium]
MKVIYSTFKLHLSQSFSRATFRFCIIFQPLIYTFILNMMYKDSSYTNYVNFVVLGSGLTSLWSSICFSSAGDIERERYMGTLENLFCSPTKFSVIIIGKVIANTFLGLNGMFLSVIFTRIFFNSSMYIKNGFLFLLCFALMIFSFICIALVISPIFTLSKNARALMNCMEYPIFILCGFIFPTDMLPGFLRYVGYILSPTWAVKILRESSLGISNYNLFYREICILLVISVIYLIISRLLFIKIDKNTRIKATLGVS